MALNKPIRQHTVTKNILLRFCNENGLFWVFDRKNNEYREQNPDDTTVVKNFYTFKTVIGEKSYELESIFCKVIEERLPLIISKLEMSEPINDEEKEILATFAALQKQKTTASRSDYIEMMKDANLSIAKMIFENKKFAKNSIEKFNALRKASETKITISPEELKEFVDALGRDNIEIPKENHIKMMLEMVPFISMVFLQLDWVFLKAPYNSSFVISDNPFSLVGKSHNGFGGIGLITPGAEKTLPLSPKICLMMLDKGNNVWGHEIDRKTVRSINCRTALNCDRYLISKDKEWLERLVNITKIDKFQRKPQMIVRTPFNR